MTSQKILGHLVHLGHLGHLAWRSKNPDYQMTQIIQMTYLFGRVIFGEVEKKGRNEHFIGRARKSVNHDGDEPVSTAMARTWRSVPAEYVERVLPAYTGNEDPDGNSPKRAHTFFK